MRHFYDAESNKKIRGNEYLYHKFLQNRYNQTVSHDGKGRLIVQMSELEERQLLHGAARFDLDVLAVIYDRYSPQIHAYALRLLGDASLAEDCTAETFARFLRALRIGRGPTDHLRAYLYRIAHNWITDSYRRQPPPPLQLEDQLVANGEPDPGRQAEEHQGQERIRLALRSLTPDQRQVLVLRFLEDLSLAETAAALDKPVGAVKALQHRAINTLQRILEKEVHDDR